MVSASKKLAVLGLMLLATAASRTARAEIDLNRLVFPKVPSASGAPAMADDPAPEPAMMEDTRGYAAPRNASAQRVAQRPANNSARTDYSAGRNTAVGYQSTTGNYAPNRARQMQQAGDGEMPATGANGNRPTNNYGEINYNPRNGGYAGGPTPNGGYQNYSGTQTGGNVQRSSWSVAGMLGMEANGSNGTSGPNRGVYPDGLAQNAPQYGMTTNSPSSVVSNRAIAPSSKAAPTSSGPMVTPEAVYLEGESIPAGVRSGSSGTESSVMMPQSGGMMMEGMPSNYGGDGFSNPYCNNCNCGQPGCSTCGGNSCDTCGGGKCGIFHGGFWGHGGNNCGGGDCDECQSCGNGCGHCGHDCPYGRPWILAPIDFVFHVLSPPHHGGWWWGQDFTFFGGVHNFRSNVNITTQSNFGTQEGVNWALPLWNEIGLGAQLGISGTQSNFQRSDFPFDEYRQQTFVTAGLFHRPACNQGFQYGVAFDWLHDEFYDDFEVGQIRGEISYLFNGRDEIGFACAVGVTDDEVTNQLVSPATFEVIDQYAIYYRRRFCRGGDARIWGGATGGSTNSGSANNDAGLVGVDFSVPISRCWAFEGGFNYVVASEDQRSSTDETWNLGMNLVWYIGGNAACRSQYRPLFNVADNGSMMTRVTGQNQ